MLARPRVVTAPRAFFAFAAAASAFACNQILGNTISDAPAAAPPAACAAGQKTCNGACVSASDPATGCGDVGCAPCSGEGAVPTCVAGRCAIAACAADRADCDGRADDGCETSLATDGASCGRCGHDCLGGACVGGVCRPVTVAEHVEWAALLAPDPSGISFMTRSASIERVNDGGHDVAVLLDQVRTPGPAFLRVGANLVFSQLDNVGQTAPPSPVLTIPLTGCAADSGICPRLLSPRAATAAGIAANADTVYWADPSAGTVEAVRWAGGATLPHVADGQHQPTGLAIAGSNLVWTNAVPASQGGAVMAAPLDGGPPVTLVADQESPDVVVGDAAGIFWRTVDASRNVQVHAASADGTNPVVVSVVCTLSPTTQQTMALDARYLYCVHHDALQSTIYAAPRGGGNAVEVAKLDGAPLAVAVDDVAIYWTEVEPTPPNVDSTVSLRKLAKEAGPLTTMSRDLAPSPRGLPRPR